MSAEACLQDISRTGAKLLVEQQPSNLQNVWFCLHDGENTVGIACEMVGNALGVAGLCVVRIAFQQPCPDRLYRIALRDFARDKAVEIPPYPTSVIFLGANDRADA